MKIDEEGIPARCSDPEAVEAAKVFGPIVCKHGKLIQFPCFDCIRETNDAIIADQERGEYSDERQRWKSDSDDS